MSYTKNNGRELSWNVSISPKTTGSGSLSESSRRHARRFQHPQFSLDLAACLCHNDVCLAILDWPDLAVLSCTTKRTNATALLLMSSNKYNGIRSRLRNAGIGNEITSAHGIARERMRAFQALLHKRRLSGRLGSRLCLIVCSVTDVQTFRYCTRIFVEIAAVRRQQQ